MLLRRKEVIDSSSLLTTLFPILISTPSKTLRTLLYTKIISELREQNSKSKNHKLNKTIQTVLHNLLTSDRTSSKGMWACRITRELWRRRVWTDERPCNVMKEACLSDNEKVVIGGVRFFLASDHEREEMDDEDSEEEIDVKKFKHVAGINKKTKKRAKMVEKAVDKIKRQERKKNANHIHGDFTTLEKVHDPQGFAEQMFQKHLQNTKCRFKLETKLAILQLVCRLVGHHKLIIISLYSWFAKYLTPKQNSVTAFLAALANATHRLIPDDAIEPLVVKIANEFVSEASATEVCAAGINAIREIAMRQPMCMSETLLQDLVLYQKSKDKGVVMAAKGLQSLYREKNPEMLQKKLRGKEATMGLRSGEIKQLRFGEEEVATGIEGIELLEKYKEEQKKKKLAENGELNEDDEDGFNSDEWEVGSEDSDDSSTGWINVDHSDSEDEDNEPSKKRRKTDDEEDEEEAPKLVDEDGNEISAAQAEANRLSKLATTTILTPADLAKLQELRREAKLDKALGNRSKRQQELIAKHIEDGVTADDIELPATIARKLTKEERVERAKDGKPGRDEHKSTQAIRKAKKDAEGKSTTNKEKQRKKNFLMTVGKARQKNKRSLVETRRSLKAHIERSKSGGRRKNGT